MARKITVEALAKAIHKELEQERWGFIDPWLFECVYSIPEAGYEEELGDNPETVQSVKSLRAILEKALASVQEE